MQVGNQPQLERAELEAVLQSGIFSRAPGLASFLQYVGERYLEGRADEIKEYSIAVEALGRPPDFDQKKDSIVRVEAHKLRKRLAEYYKGSGASHAVHIVIPNGKYAPQFVPVEPDKRANLDTTPSLPEPTTTIELVPTGPELVSLGTETILPHGKPPVRRWLWLLVVLICCAAAAMIALKLRHKKANVLQPLPTAAEEVWKGPLTQPVASEF